MEQEIENKLQEIYKNLIVEVNFVQFRKYEIRIKIEHHSVLYESRIIYTYDNSYTFNSNIDSIVKIIDNKIIIPFYKGE